MVELMLRIKPEEDFSFFLIGDNQIPDFLVVGPLILYSKPTENPGNPCSRPSLFNSY
jgi:hypothetical protein